jgi:hypothetical protein
VQVFKNPDGLSVILFDAEWAYLRLILEEIRENYEIDPDDLPPPVRKRWYSEETVQSVSDSAEDRMQWLKDLAEFRSQNRDTIGRWLETIGKLSQFPCEWLVSETEIDCLLTTLNDHRLFLASRFDISEREMDTEIQELPGEEKRGAVMGIHFCAWLMEMVILALEDE